MRSSVGSSFGGDVSSCFVVSSLHGLVEFHATKPGVVTHAFFKISLRYTFVDRRIGGNIDPIGLFGCRMFQSSIGEDD